MRAEPVFLSSDIDRNHAAAFSPEEAVRQLEDRAAEVERKEGRRVRGLLVANPGNPIGRVYSVAVVEALLRWCVGRSCHFISDEIYANSVFNTDEGAGPAFVSALAVAQQCKQVQWCAWLLPGNGDLLLDHTRCALDGTDCHGSLLKSCFPAQPRRLPAMPAPSTTSCTSSTASPRTSVPPASASGCSTPATRASTTHSTTSATSGQSATSRSGPSPRYLPTCPGSNRSLVRVTGLSRFGEMTGAMSPAMRLMSPACYGRRGYA